MLFATAAIAVFLGLRDGYVYGSSADISTIIDREGVAVRAGTHCAQPLLARYGTTATCRASFAMYNTLDEVDRLAEALEKARGFFG